jgi:hypothetical protein
MKKDAVRGEEMLSLGRRSRCRRGDVVAKEVISL